MSLKAYLSTLRVGVYLCFFSVFFVFKNLLFPYITSKQIYFNILVEVLMILWLALVIKYPSVRPKKSWITRGLAGFFGALLLSSFFGVDFNLSFWGDIERMLGWFHIIHFFLLYLIIITVFREWRDWRNLFIVSVIAAVLVCLYSLLEIPYSTIGNTAYVSGYAIFNIYFALILFFRQRAIAANKSEFWLIGVFYLLAAFIMLLVMKQTHTRGAYVGLGASFLLLFALSAFYSQSRKIKIYSLSAAVVGVALVCLVFMYPQSQLVKSSSILNTITQISSQAATFQTRLISWKAAFNDLPNHLILGTGYGNFAVTFDKYFDPQFYTYTPSETYFDRAHNNLVDIASTAGLVSLLCYFFIFGAAIFCLTKSRKQNKISTTEFSLLLCLFLAYFIQNLAVFDSLVTYISLMIALGYVYWLAEKGEEDFDPDEKLTNQEIIILTVAGLVLVSVIYQYNIKPLLMLNGTIDGQIKFAQGNLPGGVEEYKKALSYQTGLDRDSRGSLINAINSRQNELLSLDKGQAGAIADYTISLAEANVKLNPSDSMMQMQLAQILNTAATVNADNQSKFYYYSDRALEAVDKAIAASPGRVTVYFTKAQIYIARNDKDNAIKTLRHAFSLNENYTEAACYLARVEIYFKDQDQGFKDLDKCLSLNGASYLAPVDLVKAAFQYYLNQNNQPYVLALNQRWADLEPNNAKVWVNLTLLYAQAGQREKAKAAAQKVGEIDPTLKPAAEEFIRKIDTDQLLSPSKP